MRKLKVGVVGVGKLGAIHSRVYSELSDVDFVGVYDVNIDRAVEISRQFGVKTFPSLDSLLKEVDAVSVVVPTSSHFSVGMEAIKMGCHCLIEKPFTGRISLAKKLLAFARKKGVFIQVGHVERFNSSMRVLREMIPSSPIFVECHRLSPFPNRSTDVSVVMDLMIHDIDICLWFIPCKIKSVDAVGSPVITGKDDIANARIKFKNGSICDITASRVSDETMRKIRMFFPNAYVSIDYLSQEIEIVSVEKRQMIKKVIQPAKVEPLKEEILAFVSSIKRKQMPPVSGEDGLLALEVAERIDRAIRRTRREIIRRRLLYEKKNFYPVR